LDQASKDLRKRIFKIVAAVLTGSLILSAAILFWVFSSGVSIFAISGSSMVPTLHDRDTIILQDESVLQRGQIAILKKPAPWLHESEKETVLVKRVVAIPGDKLEFDGKSFLVNGVSIYNLDTIDYECKSGVIGYEHTLSNQEVFVMGDNPSASLDSRRIFCDGKSKESFVPYENLLDYGKITMKF
jgi:signal peptidase I